jgi:hypothetical protein
MDVYPLKSSVVVLRSELKPSARMDSSQVGLFFVLGPQCGDVGDGHPNVPSAGGMHYQHRPIDGNGAANRGLVLGDHVDALVRGEFLDIGPLDG